MDQDSISTAEWWKVATNLHVQSNHGEDQNKADQTKRQKPWQLPQSGGSRKQHHTSQKSSRSCFFELTFFIHVYNICMYIHMYIYVIFDANTMLVISIGTVQNIWHVHHTRAKSFSFSDTNPLIFWIRFWWQECLKRIQKTVVFNWLYRANMHFSECLDDLRFPILHKFRSASEEVPDVHCLLKQSACAERKHLNCWDRFTNVKKKGRERERGDTERERERGRCDTYTDKTW